MKRHIRSATITLILGLAAAQLIQPNTINPPVNPARSLWSDRRIDPRVADVLRRACADCHSHETEWPWYSRISPISWLVARHVSDGRAKLNLSNWTPSQDQMEEILDSVEKSKMPLSSYSLIHPQARLSQADRELLRAWVDGAATLSASN
jgi:Haem-binding domain